MVGSLKQRPLGGKGSTACLRHFSLLSPLEPNGAIIRHVFWIVLYVHVSMFPCITYHVLCIKDVIIGSAVAHVGWPARVFLNMVYKEVRQLSSKMYLCSSPSGCFCFLFLTYTTTINRLAKCAPSERLSNLNHRLVSCLLSLDSWLSVKVVLLACSKWLTRRCCCQESQFPPHCDPHLILTPALPSLLAPSFLVLLTPHHHHNSRTIAYSQSHSKISPDFVGKVYSPSLKDS